MATMSSRNFRCYSTPKSQSPSVISSSSSHFLTPKKVSFKPTKQITLNSNVGNSRFMVSVSSSSALEFSTNIGDILSEVRVFTASGQPVLFKDLWDQNEGVAVVAFLRYFECFCCWELASVLKEAKPKFDSAGVKLIAVGVGTPDKARILAERMKAILRKDGCLAAINERPMDFAYDIKWNEMDGNAMANFHLALVDEVLSSIEEKKTAKEIWDHLTKLAVPQTLQMMDMLYAMKRQPPWNYEPVSGGSVYSCNDHALEIIGVGTIKLKMYDETIKVVRDVRHVKGLKKNLLSYGLLDNNASKIETHKGIMKVFRGALVVLKGEKITANLYMLKGETLLEAEGRDFARMYPIKKKSDVFSTFKNFKARVELDSGNKIKCFRTDNGGEYTSEEFNDFCKKEGIKRQFTVANTPQQNGVAERMNRTMLERTRALLRDVGLEKSFWAEAVNTACYLGYRLWDLTARKVIISRDVIFVEDKLQRKEYDDSAEKSETTQIHVEKEFEQGDSSEAEPAHDKQESESSEAPTTRQSDRVRRRSNWHSDYVIEGNIAYCLLTEDGEPSTYQEAINSSNASLWMMAMQEEIEALHKNNTWDLVSLPQGRKPIDVKTTFLHGNLEEEIYMLQPEVLKKTKRKTWFADPCAYFKRSGDNNFVILLLYVDDILVAGPNKDHIEELKAQLAREFEMKDFGSANKILWMQIHRDRSNKKIWLSQKNYLKKILSRFSMQDCKPIYTPIPINFKLSSSMSHSSEEERMEMSRVPYASAVRSLMFAMICTRPDIAQAVRVVSRYMANSGKENWNTVKRILRYIKGTSNIALCYGGSNLLINGWVSKLQSVVATSTTEAEYVAATQASKEAIWLKMLLEELGHNQEHVSLFCDSQSALHLARNPVFHSRTKHIQVQYHFIREKVEEGTIDMHNIHTKDNIADFMTKAINADKFTRCRSSCGLLETYPFQWTPFKLILNARHMMFWVYTMVLQSSQCNFHSHLAKVFSRLDEVKKAMENYTISATPDDVSSVLQQGGMFVFKGKQLLYARKDEGTGDHTPLDDIFDVCCETPVA
ncbi:Thioredoxin superfamily protein, putative isoform 2 [Hibiscus syriacus]|uniref:Thioredoxin superfamily protein, putative isoform 2 n=1 Tax=Hibiscus syriacus TaxID=106335 RepID=A0A6A2YMX3_HIBSY|nr:Thioredoxin superfamily protein, putative isoform 2 [Hibiscus syriacus]